MPDPSKTSFEYKHLTEFTGGVRTDMRGDTIPDNALLTCQNVSIRDGVLATDKGYTKFMQDVRGTPQLVETIAYQDGSGTQVSDIVLFTTDTVYQRASGQWAYAVDAEEAGTVNFTSVSAEAASGQADISVPEADITGGKFAVNDYVGVRYKTQEAKTITTVQANNPSGKTSYILPQTDGAIFNVGDTVLVSGNTTSAYNIEQEIETVTTASGNTTIVTTTDSSAFGTSGGTTKMERASGLKTREFQTTISSIAASGATRAVTLAANLPGRVAKGATFVKAPVLDGKIEQVCDSVVVPNWTPEITSVGPVDATRTGAMVFTNGREIPKVVCAGAAGVTVRDFRKALMDNKGTTTPVTSLIAKTVSLFNGKLMFGNTIEGTGIVFLNRVRLSQLDDFEDFRVAQGGEIVELVEGITAIAAIEPMSDFVIVYKEDAIYRGDWIGSPNVSVRFSCTLHNEGVLTTKAVVPLPGYHYFVGKRNIYKYDGGKQLEPIGDAVRELLFTAGTRVNMANRHFLFTFFDPDYRELTIMYPKGASAGSREALRYHEQYKSWSTRTYNNWFTFGKTIRSHQTLTWNDLENDWNSYSQPWTGAFFVASKYHKLLLGTGQYIYISAVVTELRDTDTYVYDINEIEATDDGYTVPWEIITKDFYLPSSLIRVDFSDVFCAGDDVAITYSKDLGNIFTRVRQAEPRLDLEAERFYLNQAAKQIRFRLRGQSSTFQLGWMGFSFAPEFSW